MFLKKQVGFKPSFWYGKSKKYQKETSPERKVIDYISGMTDDYFMREYRDHFIPKRRDLTLE